VRRYTGIIIALVVAVLLYLFVFRDLYYTPRSYYRSEAAGNRWMSDGFTVAVVWPPHANASLVEGVTLAAEEVNNGGSALAGKIKLRFFTETADRALARSVSSDRTVLAVIGHEATGGAIPASITYEKHGILFLSAKSTDIRLTEHGFQYVFRLAPDDRVMTRALANFAVANKWVRVGALFGRTDHGVMASAEFIEVAKTAGLHTPFLESFLHQVRADRQDFRPVVAAIRGRQFDAIMLADELPWAGKLLRDMLTMGVTQPILATDKLDSTEVWASAGVAANNLYVASAIDPDSTLPGFAGFRERFQRRFNTAPGYGAAQGYSAFMLFVNAALRSGSVDPLVVATTLKTNVWADILGDMSFDNSGNIVGRDITIKHMRDGVFRTVSLIEETP